MALQFNGKAAVGFKDLKLVPEPTPELRLRIKQVGDFTTETGRSETIEVMASYFPSHKQQVKDFMLTDMDDDQLAELYMFLAGGSMSLDAAKDALRENIAKAMRESAGAMKRSING